MAAAYGELEKKLGAPAAPAAPVTPPVTPAAPVAPAVAPVVDDAAARKTIADAGFDFNAISKEFMANDGKLTDGTMKLLTDKGIPKEAIDTYIAGAKAAAEGIVAELTQVAGSGEKLAEVYNWAKANLSKAELDGYNSIIDQGNKDASRMVFESLFSRYNKATGTEPVLVAAARAPVVTGVAPYESNAQIVAAVSDPRYRNDAAYRDAHYARLNVTDMAKASRNQ
jgi:capsid assembly protein